MSGEAPAAPGTAGRLAQLYGLEPAPLYGPEGSTLYDRLSRDDAHEVADVLRLARGVDDPVLDLACGSGRFTLPLARRGHHVVAVDSSPRMLELLGQRLVAAGEAVAGRVRPVETDMACFKLGGDFAAIVLGTSSVCLLDSAGRAALFGQVRDHLAVGGRFIVSTMDFVDCAVPRVGTVERTSVVVLPAEEDRELADGSVVTLFQHFDLRRGLRTTSLLHRTVHNRRTSDRSIFTGHVHLVDSQQITAELAEAGLRVLERHTTWGEVDQQSGETAVLLVCGHR